MTTIALDSNNDIVIENGNLKLIGQSAQVVQSVKTRLQLFLGEWFLDINQGVPWLEEIMTKPTNLQNAESIIKSVILNTDGIQELLSFSIDDVQGNRIAQVSFSANTIYGPVSGVTVNV